MTPRIRSKNYKIIYDGTYILKGKSGIPSDAKSTLICLTRVTKNKLVTIFFDYRIKRTNFEKILRKRYPKLILNTKKIVKNKLIRYFLVRFAAVTYSIFANLIGDQIELTYVRPRKNLELPNLGVSYYTTNKTTLERFLPLIFHRSLQLNTEGFDFFIQQQIDPIKISESTCHILRLHDILPITHPDYFTDSARKAFAKGLKFYITNPKIVWVMDTHASANDFREIFGNDKKVKVIPCVVGSKFKINVTKFKKNPNQYLMVNTIEPRKNVELTAQAFSKFVNSNMDFRDKTLIIAGKRGWKVDSLIADLNNSEFGPSVKFIEDASDIEIQNLYAQSQFVISSSSAEGFGLPPLEGMMFGCIPIVSSIAQHFETIGKNGIFFETNDLALSEALLVSTKMSNLKLQHWQSENLNHIHSNFS